MAACMVKLRHWLPLLFCTSMLMSPENVSVGAALQPGGVEMPTIVGAMRSAQGGDRQRRIVVTAHRSTACARTSCPINNKQHVAPFLAPAWVCNHRHLCLQPHVPLKPAVPVPATHTHTQGLCNPPAWHVRQRKPANLHGCACMCTVLALQCAHLPMPAAGKSAHNTG